MNRSNAVLQVFLILYISLINLLFLSLFIAELNSNTNLKLDLTKIYNEADEFVRKIVIPTNKEVKNILLILSYNII